MIVLKSSKTKDFKKYIYIFGAIAIGGSFNLLIVLIAVLDLKSLYTPNVMIPLAGMIYANAMIPQINIFLAVGLVSLPGMMTGQILSGVSPLIAARYQIVVMAMVLGSAGISTILFLLWQKRLN
jgi:putative ABC transport system permease protein